MNRAGPAPEVERGSALGTTETGVADPVALRGAPGAPDASAKPPSRQPVVDTSAERPRPRRATGRCFLPRADLLSSPSRSSPRRQSRRLLRLLRRSGRCLRWSGRSSARRRPSRCFKARNTDSVLRLRVGQENDGWQVRGIGLRSIVVEKGAQSVELGLPRPNGAPAE